MGKISVVINTLNEEKNLPSALASIRDLAGEVVVVDMQSDDKTVEIAKKAGAKIYQHRRMGYVEPARNFAIEKAMGDWILVLDADEKISKSLSLSLRKIAKEGKYDYVAVPRRNIVFGKWLKHSRWWPDYNVRFFKKGKVKWDEKIHSIPETLGKGYALKAKKENAIIHHNYNSLSQFIRRMDRYTGIQARELVDDGYNLNWKDLIKKPANEFLGRYFSAQGYKDGTHGLAVAILQAFSEALVYLKVWEMKGFTEGGVSEEELVKEVRNAQKDINYWVSDLLFSQKGGLINKIRRKLRL